MQDFSDFANAINLMMDDFGLDAMLVTQLDAIGGYNPATATAAIASDSIPVRGILMELTLQSNGQGTKDKTLIKDGDKVFYARPTDYLLPILMPDGILEVDSTDDRVIVGGVTYKVVTTKVVDPSATGTMPLLFELYLRR